MCCVQYAVLGLHCVLFCTSIFLGSLSTLSPRVRSRSVPWSPRHPSGPTLGPPQIQHILTHNCHSNSQILPLASLTVMSISSTECSVQGMQAMQGQLVLMAACCSMDTSGQPSPKLPFRLSTPYHFVWRVTD